MVKTAPRNVKVIIKGEFVFFGENGQQKKDRKG